MTAAEVTGKVNGVTVTLKGTTEDGAVSFLAIPVFIDYENMIFQSEIAITCLKNKNKPIYILVSTIQQK